MDGNTQQNAPAPANLNPQGQAQPPNPAPKPPLNHLSPLNPPDQMAILTQAFATAMTTAMAHLAVN